MARGPARLRATAGLLGAVLLAGPLWAESERAEYEAELRELRQAIQELDESLREKRGAQSEAEQTLERIERELAERRERAAQTEARIAEQEARVSELEARQSEAREDLGDEREALAREAQVAYSQGRELPLRLMLSAEAPDEASRAMAYHAYIAAYRAQRIEAVSTALESLVERHRTLQAERRNLDELRDRLARERAELQERAAARRETIAQLEARIEDDAERRSRLAEEAEALDELLDGLGGVVDDHVSDPPDGAFAELEGQLPWPAQSREVASGRHGGIQLQVEAGASVRAVADGRVVYADWLQGMGMLVILDHGNGYMTLYGQAEALLREPGAWVEAGDRVALASENGDDGAHIHFEIRHEGEPLPADAWLREL